MTEKWSFAPFSDAFEKCIRTYSGFTTGKHSRVSRLKPLPKKARDWAKGGA